MKKKKNLNRDNQTKNKKKMILFCVLVTSFNPCYEIHSLSGRNILIFCEKKYSIKRCGWCKSNVQEEREREIILTNYCRVALRDHIKQISKWQ